MVSVLHMVCCLYVFFPLAFFFVAPPPPAVSPNKKVNSETSAVEGKFLDLRYYQEHKSRARQVWSLSCTLPRLNSALCVYAQFSVSFYFSGADKVCVCHKIYHNSPLKTVFCTHSNINRFCNN